MAIRTKAEMLAGITSMFADNDEGDITAAIARSEFNDWIDSLLVPGGIVGGAGISVSDNGDGSATVSAAGAAAAVGIPSYVADSAAQPSDAVLTANIAGVTDSPPFPSLVYLLTPNGLDRAADDLELRINGDTSRVRALVDFRGDPLNARDLDPGALYEILAHASSDTAVPADGADPGAPAGLGPGLRVVDRTSDAGRSRCGNGVAVSGAVHVPGQSSGSGVPGMAGSARTTGVRS